MAAAVATQQQRKFQWGELADDDGDLSLLLPPRVVLGPDAGGLRKVIEYRFDDDGKKVKVTTTTRTRSLARARLSRSAVERRSWTKFGDAVKGGDDGSRLTMVSTEEVLLERPRAPGKQAEEPTTSGDPMSMASTGGALLMVCRICKAKGDHWTSKCPYKDLAQQAEGFVDRPSSPDRAAPRGDRAYVPPNKKEGADTSGASMRRWNDENCIRVNNLSEETHEADLLELFRTFGPVTRAFVARDKWTRSSRGFGFVNFVRREDGEKAISKLNGYGYDNLILRVEWSERPN
ncbi:hypothetical protein HU200_032868 [Digitaria exilis]|uniref:Eukaryotic translation initiation factor 3 subunit G n=1 Tax=Digitaria exilis TaxID=1010633 RepID=A0A835BM70_9POAL|nr:hypothetical protein HU200_032868 [Digitaria exilis]CAB3487955.1 unnamed protein product [Digitaria exilis]